MNIVNNIHKLEEHYKMKIPQDYVSFIEKTNFFDYSGVDIIGKEATAKINHFLKTDNEYPSRDVLKWYAYADDERQEYLTIAMGFGNEEIAIKVLGENLGGVYLIIQEEQATIQKLFDSFADFEKCLKHSLRA